MAESVSAANEVKLTEAEVVTLAIAVHRLTCNVPACAETRAVLDETDMEDAELLAPTVATLLGARLSAREPDKCGEPCVLNPEQYACILDAQHDGKHADGVHRWVAVPVSGVPTEAVRELAEQWRQMAVDALAAAGRVVSSDRRVHWEHLAENYTYFADALTALVQRAAETNEGTGE